MKRLMKENKKVYLLIIVAMAILSAIAFNNYYLTGYQLAVVIILGALALVAFFLILYSAFKVASVRAMKVGFISGGIFSFIMIFGRSVYNDNTLSLIFGSLWNVLISIVDILGFTIMIGSMITLTLCWFEKHEEHIAQMPKENKIWKFFQPSWKTFIKLTLIIFACFLPCYLGYFPGAVSYDIARQTNQALGFETLSQFHPALHTLYLRLCMHLGGENGWLIIYSLSQMVMMSATFAYATMFLAKMKVKNWIVLTAFVFFAICPVNALFSFATAKDVPAALAFIMFTIFLIKLIVAPKKFFGSIPEIIGLIGFGVLACLLRNNMIYVMILFLPIILFVLGRKYIKFVLLSMGLIIVLTYAITGPLYKSVGIEPGDSREILSLPMQQIANAVINNEEKITPSELEQVRTYIYDPNLSEIYNPRFADPVKDKFKTDAFEKDKLGFIKLWGQLFVEYPGDYVNAFLSLNLPYWYVDTPFPDKFSGREYIETTSPNYRQDIVRPTTFVPLFDFYEGIAEFRSIEDIPVLSKFLSMSLPIWMLYFSAVILIFRKKNRLVLVFAPAALLWFTYLAGPVSNFRYVFPLFVLYPILLALLFSRKSKKASNVELGKNENDK